MPLESEKKAAAKSRRSWLVYIGTLNLLAVALVVVIDHYLFPHKLIAIYLTVPLVTSSIAYFGIRKVGCKNRPAVTGALFGLIMMAAIIYFLPKPYL